MSRLFRSVRYQERGSHIEEMNRRQFGRTKVNEVVDGILREEKDYPLIPLWFGDPSAYAGLDAYEGVHRFLRRYINFHKPSDYSRYMLAGYGPLVDQIRRGTTTDNIGFSMLTRRGTGVKDADQSELTEEQEIGVYMTPGVAGALRIISPALFLPPGEDGKHDNVIMPTLTYLSHAAEAALALAEVRKCRLDRDGILDLEHLESLIDNNTRAVVLATVGNPLSVAMSPSKFDELLRLLERKSVEVGHPIVLVADVIYEFFRRNRDECIDPIKRVIELGLDVMVIDTSSESKGLAMAGQRVGWFRCHCPKNSRFADAMGDLVKALDAVYGTLLDPVSSLLQKALGELYLSINFRRYKEEDLAPIAAVLVAMDELTKMAGRGDSFTLMPDEVPEDILRMVGADPAAWFTTSAIAKRCRKLASESLGGYDVDMKTSRVEEIGSVLKESGLIEERVITLERKAMFDILLSSVMKHSVARQKMQAGIRAGLDDSGAELSDAAIRTILDAQIAALTMSPAGGDDPSLKELSGPQPQEGDQSAVRLTLYRLRKGLAIPPVKRKEDGQLDLYGISSNPKYPSYEEWKSTAELCGVKREDHLYRSFKDERRREVFRRIDFMATEIEKLRQERLRIYMHPSIYGPKGDLQLERINTFYLLVGFDHLKDSACQAAEVVRLCHTLGLPLLGITPGEVFLSVEDQIEDRSYFRIVALQPIEEARMVIDVLRTIALELAHEEALRSAPPESGE